MERRVPARVDVGAVVKEAPDHGDVALQRSQVQRNSGRQWLRLEVVIGGDAVRIGAEVEEDRDDVKVAVHGGGG
jgi:hypothetical protein